MRTPDGFRKRLVAVLILATAVGLAAGLCLPAAHAAEPGPVGSVLPPSPVRWDIAFAVAISIGLPCLGAGYAIGKVGAAALGAASEKPELLTRSLIFVALGEGIAVFGLLVAILVLVLKF